VKTLEKDDFIVQTAFFTSPIKWHVGHVSWIYEAIMSKINKKYEFYSKEFSEYLNSYYQQFGVPQDKGKRGIISRPTTEQVFQYFNTISQKVNQIIESESLNNDATKLIMMGIHHECQHQELVAYDLQHLLADQYRPIRRNEKPKSVNAEQKTVQVKGGIYMMGYNGDRYCYDIELPEHKVYLEDYAIDAFPITNEQYLKFIDDGGYDTYKYWLS
ncbi:MAG: ergothioneine biosynthesis protein EgtB, partial [Nitrosopumilus sp. CG10_big_fil_rev_8_21_14_0_10_33_7]